MNIIDVISVSKRYHSHQALQKLDLKIPSQGIFGLLGPNGAGKTTLIRILIQILLPDSGQVLYNGQPLNSGNRAQFGYLPEERGLYKKMKVKEQLMYFARLRGITSHDASQKIDHWLEKLEIAPWKNNQLENLSKGMQQKVQFIASILHEPEVVILDEPFSGFDPVNAELITKEILNLKAEGKTIIFSTHRMETVESLCDSIALIHRGTCVLEGNLQQVKMNFRKNIYTIEGKGTLSDASEVYQILSCGKANGFDRYQLKLMPSYSTNDLLSSILPYMAVSNFQEMLPSMHDIFIGQITNHQLSRDE